MDGPRCHRAIALLREELKYLWTDSRIIWQLLVLRNRREIKNAERNELSEVVNTPTADVHKDVSAENDMNP